MFGRRAETAVAVMVALFLVLAACAPEETDDEEVAPDPAEEPADDEAAEAEWPERLVLGMVPSREADVMIENFAPGVAEPART